MTKDTAFAFGGLFLLTGILMHIVSPAIQQMAGYGVRGWAWLLIFVGVLVILARVWAML